MGRFGPMHKSIQQKRQFNKLVKDVPRVIDDNVQVRCFPNLVNASKYTAYRFPIGLFGCDVLENTPVLQLLG